MIIYIFLYTLTLAKSVDKLFAHKTIEFPDKQLKSKEDVYKNIDTISPILNENEQIELFPQPIISIQDCKNQIRLAAIAYCSENTIMSKTCSNFDDTTGNIEVSAVIKDDTYETFGFVSVNHETKKIIISYRGTKNVMNWGLNFDIVKIGFYGDSEIHSGFKLLGNSLLNHTIYNIKQLLVINPDYGIVFTGHSMGGAIAVINAVETMHTLNIEPNMISLYTYGQPRVGDKKFTDYINKLQWNINRVFNKNDLIPDLPPNSFRYYHTNVGIGIGSPEDTTICDPNLIEDKACMAAPGSMKSSEAHFIYWDYSINHNL